MAIPMLESHSQPATIGRRALILFSIGLVALVAVFAFTGTESSPSGASQVTTSLFDQNPASSTQMAAVSHTGGLNKCAGPQWDPDTEVPEINYPEGMDSNCNKGLWADNDDGSIRSFGIELSDEDLAWLDADPQREEWNTDNPNSTSSCTLVVNYGRHDEFRMTGGKCRYKGSSGSFGGCIAADGSRVPPNEAGRDCKLSWKLNMKDATIEPTQTSGRRLLGESTSSRKGKSRKGKSQAKTDPAVAAAEALVRGSEKFQFSGMNQDPSLTRTMLGYNILNDAGFVAPCSSAMQLYVNGHYQGLYSNTENPDHVMTQRRPRLASDDLKGKGSVYKEVWPLSTEAADYEMGGALVTQNPGFNNPGLKDKAKGKTDDETDMIDNAPIFANLTREAIDCVDRGNEFCTKEKATEILEKYTDPQSFIDGLVGLTLTGNWDSVLYTNHNYMMYIRNNKLFYLSWDLDQTMAATNTGGKYPLVQTQYPWYHWDLSAQDRKYLCQPGGDTSPPLANGGQYEKTYQFGCNAVNNLMGRAWKERFFETYHKVYPTVNRLMKEHLARWKVQQPGPIQCQNDNGYGPSFAFYQAAIYGLSPEQAAHSGVYQPKYWEGPGGVFIPTTTMEEWNDFYHDMWTRLSEGDESAYPRAMLGLDPQSASLRSLGMLLDDETEGPADSAYCLIDFNGQASALTPLSVEYLTCMENAFNTGLVSKNTKHPMLDVSPYCTLAENCGTNFTQNKEECTRRCSKFFQPCFMSGSLAADCDKFPEEQMTAFKAYNEANPPQPPWWWGLQ